MASIDDTQCCAQCEAWARKLEQAQKRVAKLENMLYDLLCDWDMPFRAQKIDRILGKRRLRELAKET